MVRVEISVTVIVLNDGILGFQKDAETVKYQPLHHTCHFSVVDHSAIAVRVDVKI